MVTLRLLAALSLGTFTSAHGLFRNPDHALLPRDNTSLSIPFETRAYWMRAAIASLAELESPCPFAAFGTVIVNHTDVSEGEKGKLVCMGVNENSVTGNPTLHGEMAAINNCTTILTDPAGEYNLTAAETLLAFSSLSLYTTAESCPMCASAIRWAGFREYIYASTIATLIEKGWSQINISSADVFAEATALPYQTVLISDVLVNETDPYFEWQYNTTFPCPQGCGRTSDGSSCAVSE